MFPLTVGAAVHLHSEAHPAAGVPVQRYEAQETCPDRVGQPVLDHSLRVHVPDEFLRRGQRLCVCQKNNSASTASFWAPQSFFCVQTRAILSPFLPMRHLDGVSKRTSVRTRWKG